MSSQKWRLLAMVVVSALMIPALPPLPVQAATTPCSVIPTTTSSDGTQVSGKVRMNCTSTNRNVCSINVKVQERSFGVISTRNNVTYNYAGCWPVDVTSPTTAANCAGHGTDDWRIQGTGTDDEGDTRTSSGTWKQHTCN